MTGAELPALNLADLQTLLRRREVSPGEVLGALRARIAEVDPKIDAYLSIDQEAAVQEAQNRAMANCAIRFANSDDEAKYLADKLRTIEIELSGLKERVGRKAHEFSILLDKAIE